MKRIDICTILLNDSKTERQTISYDPNDKMLHTTAEEDVVDETEYETIEEAEEACYQMWGRSYAWELEWIERDDEEDETMKTYRPEPDGVFTVRELIDILRQANPDALIVTGAGLNHCENYIERVVINNAIVGLFTEPDDEEADQ